MQERESTVGTPIQQFVWLGDTPVAVMGGSAGTGTVDNTSSQVLVTGTWPQTQSSAAQGGNYRSHAAGSGAASFTWTLNPRAADYQLYARWVAGTDRASNATYRVTHAAGVSPVPVDQRVNGSQWVLLGSFRFTFGTGHGVTLTDAADGVVVADAIRILPAGPILSYVYADHLDTPGLLTDDTGRVRWRWLADPFGTVLPENNPEAMGPFTFNLRFPGQRFDWETGLHYNVFRDYDPGTGRYVEGDPIGLRGGISVYTYVGGNPVTSVDPRGLIQWTGTAISAGVGNGSKTRYTLFSECIDGYKMEVVVDVLFYSWGGGASLTTSAASFTDGFEYINPYVFDGPAVNVSAGLAAGFGTAFDFTILGGSSSPGAWGAQTGIGAWAGVGIGQSEVISTRSVRCSCPAR